MPYLKQKRRVSIIMGIYNCAKTLPEAIDSIISQTYKDWELIMCDDGSTDNSVEIASKYEQEFDNILLLQNEHNCGLPTTLNHCLDYAESEYIARMDGDDISLPERLEKEVLFLDEHPEYAIVSCAMINFDENGDWGIQRKLERPTKRVFLYDSPFCHAPCMMRRYELTSVGNYTVRPDLRRGQDYYLWHKFYCAGYKGYNIQEAYYKMRDDRDAANRRGFDQSLIDRLSRRLTGARIQREVQHNLGFSPLFDIYALRPILTALLPKRLYFLLHKMKLRKQ